MNILPDRQKTRQTLPDGSYLCPVVVEFNSNARKVIRNRTVEDDMAEPALKKGERPSRRARMMANAIFLEDLLERGVFSSPHELARRCGIRPDTIYECLALLNRPAEEVEGVLFETK